MFYPARHMSAAGIGVSPVNHTTFITPLILAVKLNRITHFKCCNPWRQIDIVRHQQCLPRPQTNDKTLMPAAIIII